MPSLTLARRAASTRPVPAPASRRAPARRRATIAVLAVVALACVLALVLTDLPTRWEYALRLRTTTAAGMVLAAVAIGAATVLFQTVTANRVLTPGVMGFDAVFVLMQTVAAFALGPVFLLAAPAPVTWLTELLLMVGVTVALYWWLFVRRRLDLPAIVLAGIVVGTLLRSLTSFVQRLLDPDTFAVVQNAMFASFTKIDDQLLLPTAVVVGVALVSLVPVRRSLDVLALGEVPAIGLGVEHRRVTMHVVVVVALLVAASTALVGPVTFFGLLVANVAYTLVGHRHAYSIPAAVLLGVITLAGGQLLLDRVLGFGTELPIVIEFVGGAVFIAFVLTGRAK